MIDHCLISQLQRMSQTTISLGAFPAYFKGLKATAIDKKGDPNTCNILKKLRIIAVGQIMDSLLQRQVEAAFQQYLIKHNLISRWQHGFRKKMGTSTLLAEIMTSVCESDVRHTKYMILCSYDGKNAFGLILGLPSDE